MENDINTVRTKLDQLEGFLHHDPNNSLLLAEAFYTALRCQEWSRAEFHLCHAQALNMNVPAWSLRESDFWLAQRQWDKARATLERLQVLDNVTDTTFADVVLHNQAYIDFSCNNFSACIARLAPRLDAAHVDAAPALKVLWLRALHRARETERAYAWAQACERHGHLDAQSASVASLAALDVGNFTAAKQWADLALSQSVSHDTLIEALVTAASLALTERNIVHVEQLIDLALRINPNEGRAWSVLAFADLLNGNMVSARKHFARALIDMPKHIGTWHGQGWTQILQREFDGAQTSFETALKLDRNFAESHGALAVVFILKSLPLQAQEHLDRGKRLDNNSVSVHYAQALLNGDVQDTTALQKLATRLLRDRAARNKAAPVDPSHN